MSKSKETPDQVAPVSLKKAIRDAETTVKDIYDTLSLWEYEKKLKGPEISLVVAKLASAHASLQKLERTL
jgi:hypothetical protein